MRKLSALRPSDWQPARLDRLASINSETLGVGTRGDFRFRYIDISSVSKGSIEWAGVSTEAFSTAPSRARRVAREGDVLYGTVRPGNQSHGRVSGLESNLVASTGFAVLRPVEGVSDSAFLFHMIMGEEIASLARRAEVGSGYPAVNESDLAGFVLYIPEAFEQTRIAAILDTLDDTIRQTEQVIAKLQQMKQGLLHDLLTRGIDENGEVRDPERRPELFKDSVLGRIPRVWEVRSMPKMFAKVSPGVRRDQRDCVATGRTPVLDQSASDFMGYSNVEPGVMASRERPAVTFANHTCAVRWITFPCSAIQNVFFMRGAAGVTDRYLYYSIRGRVQQQTYQGHWPLLQEMTFALPPESEQRLINARLDGHEVQVDEEERLIAKLRLLKQGLMDDLLTGRVRTVAANEIAE